VDLRVCCIFLKRCAHLVAKFSEQFYGKIIKFVHIFQGLNTIPMEVESERWFQFKEPSKSIFKKSIRFDLIPHRFVSTIFLFCDIFVHV